MEGDFVRQLAMSQREAQAGRDGRNERKSERDLVDEIAAITQRMQKTQKYLDDRAPKLPEDLENAANSMMILENQRNALGMQLGKMQGEIERQLQMQSRAPETYMRGFKGQPAAQDTIQALIIGLQQLQSAGSLAGPGASPEEQGEGWRLAQLGAEKERMFGGAQGSESQQLAERLRELLEQGPFNYRPQAGGRGYFDYE